MEQKKGTLLCFPRKIKWYIRMYRIPIIWLHGKYGLTKKLKERDHISFLIRHQKIVNKLHSDIIRKYGSEFDDSIYK